MPTATEISPPVFYFGTPVVLLTTANGDGTDNITPMSSAWALGDRYVVGLGAESQGALNLRHRPELVLNLAGAHQARAVEAIAQTTGRSPVPNDKRGAYTFVSDKWSLGGFTPLASVLVEPARVGECPVQIEGRVVQEIAVDGGDAIAYEVEVLQSHAHVSILVGPSRIDTDRWRPLYYTFRHYFAQGPRVGTNFRAALIEQEETIS